MFPLRDENPTRRLAWMTWLLIIVNVAAFAYELWLLAAGQNVFTAFMDRMTFIPAALLATPFSPQVWMSVMTAMFLHAGWLHLGGNMLYLAIFGNNVEDRIGPWWFLAFYLASGIAATLAQSFGTGFPAIQVLGASGAVAGVLGAYILLYPHAKVLTAVLLFFIIELVSIPAWIVIAVWFVLQLGAGLASIGPQAQIGGVAYLAHVGGFLAGMALIAPAWFMDRRRARFVAWR